MSNTEKQRYWLTFGEAHLDRPMLWEMARQFPDVVFNIRSAKVDGEVGIIALVLEGQRGHIKEVVAWFEQEGAQVEPVEIQTIEG